MVFSDSYHISFAHRLHNSTSGEDNLHGHTYKVSVTIDLSQIFSSPDYIEDDVVWGSLVNMDAVNLLIMQSVDNGLLLCKRDPLADEFLKNGYPGVQITEYIPTKVNIAKYLVSVILHTVSESLRAHVRSAGHLLVTMELEDMYGESIEVLDYATFDVEESSE